MFSLHKDKRGAAFLQDSPDTVCQLLLFGNIPHDIVNIVHDAEEVTL